MEPNAGNRARTPRDEQPAWSTDPFDTGSGGVGRYRRVVRCNGGGRFPDSDNTLIKVKDVDGTTRTHFRTRKEALESVGLKG